MYIRFSKKEIVEIQNHPILKEMYDLTKSIVFSRKLYPNKYYAITHIMLGQLLSVKSAQTIFNKLDNYIKDWNDEQKLINLTIKELDECSIRGKKAIQILNIYQKIYDKEFDISYEKMQKLTNNEIIDYFKKEKGLGVWSAEMFMIFFLQRKNVFSYLDAIVRKGISWIENEPIKDIHHWNRIKDKYEKNGTLISIILWGFFENVNKKYRNWKEYTTYYHQSFAWNDKHINIKATNLEIVSVEIDNKPFSYNNENELTNMVKTEIINYLKTNKFSSYPFSFRLAFDQKVQDVLYAIKNINKICSYSDISELTNLHPRIVAKILANNKHAILFPCHKVIGKDKNIKGFRWGLDTKKILLNNK